MHHHERVIARACGHVVMQCRCIAPKFDRYIDGYCSECQRQWYAPSMVPTTPDSAPLVAPAADGVVVYRNDLVPANAYQLPETTPPKGIAVQTDADGNIIGVFARFRNGRVVELQEGDRLVYCDGDLFSVVVQEGNP